jgi:putative ABC transport system permease protein
MRFVTFLLKNLCRRKARSILTGCGVAVAVGTTVALLGVSDGFERSSVESFEARGVDAVVVADGVLDQLSSDLDEAYADRIRRLPGVRAVAPGLVELVEYPNRGTIISVLVQGWQPDSFLFDELELVGGRRVQPGDKRVAMLGATLAENIGKKTGDTITIQREPFKVIGVYRSLSVYENGAVVPLGDLQEVMVRDGSVTGFSVVVEKSGPGQVPVETVCRQINALAGKDGQSLGLSAMPTRQYVSSSMHIRMAHAMAWLTSTIAIVVGAIGVLNTMVMSVVERVREISILRAIGWRRGRVVRMILGESLLLSLAGAVLGVAGAIVLTGWLATLPQVAGFIQGNIAPEVVAKGFLMALAVALVGGSYPAWQASRLSPSEGLRHE